MKNVCLCLFVSKCALLVLIYIYIHIPVLCGDKGEGILPMYLLCDIRGAGVGDLGILHPCIVTLLK